MKSADETSISEVTTLRAKLAAAETRIAELEAMLDRLDLRKVGRKPALDEADFRCMLDMRAQGITNAGIARGMGISPAVVTLFFQGRYPTPPARRVWGEHIGRKKQAETHSKRPG